MVKGNWINVGIAAAVLVILFIVLRAIKPKKEETESFSLRDYQAVREITKQNCYDPVYVDTEYQTGNEDNGKYIPSFEAFSNVKEYANY